MCVYNCVSVFIILRASIEQSHDQLPQTPGPLYEELQPSTSAPEYQVLVERKENVAYG